MAVRPLPTSGITNTVESYVAPSFDISEQIRSDTQQNIQFFRELRSEQEKSEAVMSDMLSKINPMEMWEDADGELMGYQTNMIENAKSNVTDMMMNKKGLLNAFDIAQMKKSVQEVQAFQQQVKTVESKARSVIDYAQKHDDLFDVKKTNAKVAANYKAYTKGLREGKEVDLDFDPVIRKNSKQQTGDGLISSTSKLPKYEYKVKVTSKDKKGNSIESYRKASIPEIFKKEGSMNTRNPIESVNMDAVYDYFGSTYRNNLNDRAAYKDNAITALKNKDAIPQKMKADFEERYGISVDNISNDAQVDDFGEYLYVNEWMPVIIDTEGSYSSGPDEKNKSGTADKSFVGEITEDEQSTLAYDPKYKKNVPYLPFTQKGGKVNINTKDIYHGKTLKGWGDFTKGVTRSVGGVITGFEEPDADGKVYARVSIKPAGDEKDALLFSTLSRILDAKLSEGLASIRNSGQFVVTDAEGDEVDLSQDNLNELKESKAKVDYTLQFKRGSVMLIDIDKLTNSGLTSSQIRDIKSQFKQYGESKKESKPDNQGKNTIKASSKAEEAGL